MEKHPEKPASFQEVLTKLHQLASENPTAFVASAIAVVAAGSYIAARSSVRPLRAPFDFSNQTVIIDEKTGHRASRLCEPPDYFTRRKVAEDVNTVYGALARGLRESNNGPCLGARTGPSRGYEWKSYQEIIDSVQQFGSGLVHMGITACNETKVGIYATNRPQWTIADFGCQAYSMCPVPLYDTLGLQAIKFIIQQCDIEVVVCDTEARVKILIELKPDLPKLRLVVFIESVSQKLRESADDAGLDMIDFEQLLRQGKLNLTKPVPAKPTDVFSICYTSGTTGNPKGVVLTQFAMMSMVQSMMVGAEINFLPNPQDVHLSYLPLAHNFERGVQILMLLSGGQIGFSSRDIKLLTDDLQALRPTVFPTVPRLLNRIYDAVHAEVRNSRLKSTILKLALGSKHKEVNRLIYRKDSFWDKILFNKVQDKLGGRVRVVMTGSAPLSSEVMTFLRCAFGCPVMEGYGQTESGAGISMTVPGDPSVGNVGPPLPGCHVKLADVPEMNYYAKDNHGEICAKADYIMTGYYREPEKTAEALDEDGWLHTGDIGTWLENGTLKVIDRKKNIFKLAQGEYVATEKIENVYQNSPFVGQIFVDGDSLQTTLMAVVVPDQLYLDKWAKSNNFPSNVNDFCQHKDAKGTVLKDLHEQGKKAKLAGFEQVQDIYLETEPFSVENDLLTPTLKNKRPALRNKYKNIIAELYVKNGHVVKG